MAKPFRVQVLNQISAHGLKRLPADLYEVGKDLADPDAILVRSADMHCLSIAPSVRAIGRAGAGTNNIPVAAMSERGVPVFNAPGANANAVKELVLAGMLMAARHLPAALQFVAGLDPTDPNMDARVEDGKKAFAGFELAGHTLGVIGLGRIGCLVADAAIRLGMNVIGYDPDITIDAAWSLPSQVRKANSVNELLKASHFVSLHVPLVAATRHLISAQALESMRQGAVLLNFSREGVVDDNALLAALAAERLRCYVCDFPGPAIHRHPRAIALPHLGASTREAEDNCALMVADQLRDYLEHGNVRNAVNFPDAVAPRESAYRVAIANANVPNMLGQISTAMAQANLNIRNMLNKSRGDMAYTLVDVDSAVPASAIESIAAIQGVRSVRYLLGA
ncbi:MAG: phosphoglycerate dehydrogenase [Burkholderiales bacterium]|nr:phosphoglycerate dehydrogenase [Burkholderiales bacterium]